MKIDQMILGFLDWMPLTGYQLKGVFSKLDFIPWGGNNNQIYKALVELERQGLVEKEVIQQDNYPAKKQYSVTDAGRAKLRQAVLEPWAQTVVKNDFLLHLSWSHYLSQTELLELIDRYQQQIEDEFRMCRETIRRGRIPIDRTQRETYIWDMITRNRADYLQTELNWLARLRNGLHHKEI